MIFMQKLSMECERKKIEMKKENKYLDRHVTHSRGWVQLAAAIASRARKVGSARLLFWIPGVRDAKGKAITAKLTIPS